jgi:DNA-directed RNA polymerase subunit RPC12/RpoP
MDAPVPRYAFCHTCARFENTNAWVTSYQFCPDCGTKFLLECPECKEPFVRAGKFCTECGHRLFVE